MATKAKTPKSLLFTLALISTALAVILHGYLTFRHFELSLGHTESSLCNISSTFNCDTVAASSYSTLFGIPIALFGAVTNAVLLMMALFARFSWDGESSTASRWTTRIATLVFLTSIAMAFISFTKMKVYCPFCIATYVLSIISFLGFSSIGFSQAFESLGSDIPALFKTDKGLLLSLISIPIASWMLNGMLIGNYEKSGNLKRTVKLYIQEWKNNRQVDFSSHSALAIGPSREDAKMIIVEFADFLCGHCKTAAPKLHAFAKANPDVRLEFFSFPLDGSCNPAISRKSGLQCKLAKATLCAGENAWQIHDDIFDKQSQLRSSSAINSALKEMAAKHNMDHNKWMECIQSEKTHAKIKSHAELGRKAGVSGTPAIYVNGRKLTGGQNIPLLKAAYAEL